MFSNNNKNKLHYVHQKQQYCYNSNTSTSLAISKVILILSFDYVLLVYRMVTVVTLLTTKGATNIKFINV